MSKVLALPKVIVIVGPTASGKTALAITIAKRIRGEIVSADSRQIYRGMDIGTAKPTKEEMRAVPHHLIDIKDPHEEYTVAEYKRDAILAIENIIASNKVPLLVGGTGLYISTVLSNLDIPKVAPDARLRAEITKEIEEQGLEAVFKKLVALDPEAAYIVDPKNPRRVVRALEVARTTGLPFTAQRKKNDPIFNALTIGLNPAPEMLRERIDARVDQMIQDGLLKEVKNLVSRYGEGLTAFDAIGYREILQYQKGTLTLEEAIALIKINTWHYARRQITWFKKDKNVHWMSAGDEEALKSAESFLAGN